MELVVVVRVTLHRIGSASATTLVNEKEETFLEEIADESHSNLKELVKSIALSRGETKESLERLHEDRWYRTPRPQGVVYFNVLLPKMQYNFPYATCEVHPTLKIGGRYFKQTEILR